MRKALIVDDKADVRLSVKLILEDAGYETAEAANGAEAIQKVQDGVTTDLDVIITDIMMPEVDGIEFMTGLKVMNSSVPILAISGGGYSMDAQEMINAAAQVADHVLKKPFTQDELLVAVETARGNKMMEQTS